MRPTLEIQEAYSLNEGKRIDVNKTSIEDKPTAAKEAGFDIQNKISFAFSDVKVGTKLFLKTKRVVHEVPIRGLFRRLIDFSSPYVNTNHTVIISSELPIYFHVNDPKKSLEVSESKDDDIYSIKIKVKRPFANDVVEEDREYLEFNRKTWVLISTVNAWSKVNPEIISKIENVLNEPLPEKFVPLLEAAKNKKTFIDKANFITAALAESVRYLKDWRTLDGGIVPHHLKNIAEMGYGDCKDYSALTISIFRKLGINAKMAWVQRGPQPVPVIEDVAHDPFDHAIVYVRVDDKPHWVDPTNGVSFAQGIFTDISGRKAVVLDRNGFRVESIPLGSPEDSIQKSSLELTPHKNGDMDYNLSASCSGKIAAELSETRLLLSEPEFNYSLIKASIGASRIKTSSILTKNLSSRVVSPISIHIRAVKTNDTDKTTAGFGRDINMPNLAKVISALDVTGRESGLDLTRADIQIQKYIYKNISVIGRKPSSCELNSKWVNFSRVLTKLPVGLSYTNTQIVKKAEITNEELRSKEFERFQGRVRECFNKTVLVFKIL